MTTSHGNLSKSYIVHSIISVALMIGGGFLSPIGGITEYGMKVLGIFIGVVYAWCFVEFIWPSLLAMLLLSFSGYGTLTNIFAEGMGNQIVTQLIFTFIFIGIISDTGLTDYLAKWFITRKFCNGKPWVLTLTMLYAALIIGGFIHVFAAVLVLWAVFYSICENVGFKKGEHYVAFMVMGFMGMAQAATVFLPFLPMSIIYYGLTCQIVGNVTLPNIGWWILGLVFTVLLPIVYTLLGKFIFKFDLSKMQGVDMNAFVKVEKMTKEQKYAMALLVMFISILVLPGVMTDCVLKTVLSGLSVLGAASIGLVLFCCLRTRENKKVFNFSKAAAKGLSWDVVVMLVATVPISSAFESADTGILSTIIGSLMPYFTDMGAVLFVITTCIVLCIVTQFVHNMVLLIAVMPTLAGVCMNLGIDPILYVILLSAALNLAMVTPGASVQAALAFGQIAWLEKKDGIIFGTLVAVSGMLVILCVGLPLGLMLW